MGTWIKTCAALSLFFLAVLTAAPANAQATRTWISGVGDDANPCSRTAPCKTFAGAISKTASGGEIDCLDPGGYGAVTITKAITLDCGGGVGGQVGSILVSGTNGVNINAGASDRVKIRNLTINGTNGSGINGIRFNTGASLTVEHVGIFGFGGSNGAGVGFVPSTPGSKLVMRDVEIQNNNGDGILVSPTSGATVSAMLTDVMSVGNGLAGLHATDGAQVTAAHSTFSNNTGKGIQSVSSAAATTVNLDSDTIAGNSSQGVLSSGANSTVRLSNVGIYNNAVGLQSGGSGAIISFQNNRNAGNGTAGAPTATATLQ